MKLTKELVIAASLSGLFIISMAFISVRSYKEWTLPTVKGEDKGFALVELFTSEGCSSCPPADALVARIVKENPKKPIYIMAYHVDYWNRGGWKDVYSDAEYTRRQEKYGSWLNLQTIYTPQIIVNGKTEFVGSDENALSRAIVSGLEEKPSKTFTMTSSVINGEINVSYQTNGTLKESDLVIGLVQKSGQSEVRAGENAGRTLNHVQIVRKLSAGTLHTSSGSISLALPKDYKATEWELIGFVQDKATGLVLAATRTQLL